MLQVVTAPQVTLISRPVFLNPDHFPFKRSNDNNAAQDLVEFSGRLCYLSFGEGSIDGHKTVQGRTSAFAYHQNLLDQGHGSVLEHANFSLLLEGISRSLTHELVRHRAGFAYSQLSQRFVKAEGATFVLPPAIRPDTKEYHTWLQATFEEFNHYRTLLGELAERYGKEDKRVREAARSVLPNACETKVVATGNIRAWRHLLEMRGSEGADAEFRRLAISILPHLSAEAPHLFYDFIVRRRDGKEWIESKHTKV
jgi:thymidylate synthase (FAD)